MHRKLHLENKWLMLIVVMIGTMMSALDSSIVNVSIPAIMADFGSSVDDIEWVVTGYMLAFATLMPLTAWLRDRVGYKILYIGSLIVFTLGSLLCGLAWNLPSLIMARVIQALGGGAINPTGMAMISESFLPQERGKAMGYWGMGVILGPAIGPTLGGLLTNNFGWRSIFLVNLPIGILGVGMAVQCLASDPLRVSRKRSFDFFGFFFLSVFLITLLLGLSKGEHEGWNSAYMITCGLLSVVSLIGFFLVETQVEVPIIDLSLFKIPLFSVCVLITAVRSVALYGGIFLLPLFLQGIMGFDEIESGLILFPGALVIAMCMPFAGQLSDRIGSRAMTWVGLCATALFMYRYRFLDIQMTVWALIQPTLIRGVGMGLLMAPVMAAALNSVATHQAGMAASILNILQQVAGSLGIAVLATTLSHRTHFHLSWIGIALQEHSSTLRDTFERVFHHAMTLGYSHSGAKAVTQTLIGNQMVQTASIHAFQDAFLVGAGIVVLGLLPACWLPKRVVRQSQPKGVPVVES